MTMERRLNLFHLNEDCLSEVFSYLTLTEQLKFASITSDFNAIIARQLQTNTFVTSECRNNFTVNESKRILDGIGCFIKRLNCDEVIHEENIDFYDLLTDQCTNITGVELYVSLFTDQFINFTQKLFTISNQIEDLRIKMRAIIRENGLLYKVESMLPNLPNLRTLRYYYSPCAPYDSLVAGAGDSFHKLRNLIDLNIANCLDLSKDAFNSLFDSIQLQKLNICGCTQLDRNIVNKMVQTQTELRDVTISCEYNNGQEMVARLRSLKHLTLYVHESNSALINNMLAELITHHANDLETLRILPIGHTVGPTKHLCFSRIPIDYDPELEPSLNEFFQLKNLRELIYLSYHRKIEDDNLEEMSIKLRKLEKLALSTCQKPLITDAGIFAIATQTKYLKELTLLPGHRFNRDILQRIGETRNKFGYGILRIYMGEITARLHRFLKSKEYKRNTSVLKIIKTDADAPIMKFLPKDWFDYLNYCL